jgi:fluoroquinolone resistance protein
LRLREADLEEVRAKGATLLGLDLSGAVLDGADLSGAVLRGSDLSALDPRSARLDGAVVDVAQAVVLAEALGLVVTGD